MNRLFKNKNEISSRAMSIFTRYVTSREISPVPVAIVGVSRLPHYSGSTRQRRIFNRHHRAFCGFICLHIMLASSASSLKRQGAPVLSRIGQRLRIDFRILENWRAFVFLVGGFIIVFFHSGIFSPHSF